jgi:hypothetical protein
MRSFRLLLNIDQIGASCFEKKTSSPFSRMLHHWPSLHGIHRFRVEIRERHPRAHLHTDILIVVISFFGYNTHILCRCTVSYLFPFLIFVTLKIFPASLFPNSATTTRVSLSYSAIHQFLAGHRLETRRLPAGSI